jgi:hypothetical protein
MQGYKKKVAICKPGREPSSENESACKPGREPSPETESDCTLILLLTFPGYFFLIVALSKLPSIYLNINCSFFIYVSNMTIT